jgi:hypothetical protein
VTLMNGMLKLAAAAVFAALVIGSTVASASVRAQTSLTYLVRNAGLQYVTASGTTDAYPGRLDIGDRIFAKDVLIRSGRVIGYDDEACTVTFDGNDLCHVVAVIKGAGSVDLSWLWVGRNLSRLGPQHFEGVVDGGTGLYVHASGQFLASALPTGELRVSARLR